MHNCLLNLDLEGTTNVLVFMKYQKSNHRLYSLEDSRAYYAPRLSGKEYLLWVLLSCRRDSSSETPQTSENKPSLYPFLVNGEVLPGTTLHECLVSICIYGNWVRKISASLKMCYQGISRAFSRSEILEAAITTWPPSQSLYSADFICFSWTDGRYAMSNSVCFHILKDYFLPSSKVISPPVIIIIIIIVILVTALFLLPLLLLIFCGNIKAAVVVLVLKNSQMF